MTLLLVAIGSFIGGGIVGTGLVFWVLSSGMGLNSSGRWGWW